MFKQIRSMYVLLLVVLMLVAFPAFPQKDSTKTAVNFKTEISVTNNGISLIPSFSLGKPAIIFDASIGNRLTFDPTIRFSLEGKPWSFIFRWRYILLKQGKFQMNIGANPAVSFNTIYIKENGIEKELLRGRRNVMTEVYPYFKLSKNISVGLCYNYSRRIEKWGTKNTNFITARSSFSNIKLTDQLSADIMPYFFYLKLDKNDGIYFTSTIDLKKRNFPFYISSVISKIIRSNIVGDNFVWNVSLNYTINKQIVSR